MIEMTSAQPASEGDTGTLRIHINALEAQRTPVHSGRRHDRQQPHKTPKWVETFDVTAELVMHA